jgi:predicted transposase YbfD/YdcC
MTAAEAATAIRAHWAIEASLHWELDVTFNEDKARSRTGHGPANMAVVRHFAFNMLRMVDDRRSIELRRKRAARNSAYLNMMLQP